MPRLRVARAGLLNTVIGLLAAALTFLSLALIANRFGSSSGSDAYFFLLSVVTTSTALLGGILSAVLLPQLVEARVKIGMAHASELVSQLFFWLILLCLALVAPLTIYYDQFFALASRFTSEQVQAQQSILRLLGPVLFFSVLGEYLRISLLGIGRYAGAAFMATVTPVVLVGVLLLGNSVSEASLALALAWSRALMVVGALAMLAQAGLMLWPRLHGMSHARRFARASGPYGAASVITQLSIFFFDYMASGLGAGVLTSVTLAHRIFALPLMLLVTPLLEIARVRFAEFQAKGDQKAFQRQYDQLSTLVIYMALPAAALLLIFSREIVSLLFQRGAFNSQNVEVAATCLKVLAWSVPLGCFFTLNGRVVESFQQLSVPALLGSVGNLCLMALTYRLVGEIGFKGIPLARLAIDLLYFLPFGVWMLSRHHVRVRLSYLFPALVRATIACSIPVGLVLVTRSMLLASNMHVSEAWLLIAFVMMGVAYVALVFAMDPQVRSVAKSIR